MVYDIIDTMMYDFTRMILNVHDKMISWFYDKIYDLTYNTYLISYLYDIIIYDILEFSTMKS